jgi:hypothetical protein
VDDCLVRKALRGTDFRQAFFDLGRLGEFRGRFVLAVLAQPPRLQD